MPTTTQWLSAFARQGEQERFNPLLAVNGYPDSDDDIPVDAGLAIGDAILCAIKQRTPRQMMELFPIKKEYDGERFG